MPSDIICPAAFFQEKYSLAEPIYWNYKLEVSVIVKSMEWSVLVIILELTVITNICIFTGWLKVNCSKELRFVSAP